MEPLPYCLVNGDLTLDIFPILCFELSFEFLTNGGSSNHIVQYLYIRGSTDHKGKVSICGNCGNTSSNIDICCFAIVLELNRK